MEAPNLSYDYGLMEILNAVSRSGLKGLLESLTKPPRRFYIRVNTLKVEPDRLASMAAERGLDLRFDENIPYALWAPVEGPFSIKKEGKEVMADYRSSESVYLGSDLYAPGVLRAHGVKKGNDVTVVTPNGLAVGFGTAANDGTQILKTRRGLAVSVNKSTYRSPKVRSIPGFNEGLFYSQSYPSMWVAELAEPRPGQIIIDMTAAPGGKVSHVAQLVGPKAKVIAIDRASKVQKLKETLTTLGMPWVTVIGGDSRQASELLGIYEQADTVLLDPPCTNLGVIPKLHDSRTVIDAINLSAYQFQFIREAYRLLRPGGLLVYSTCTLTDVENELNVLRALELGFDIERPTMLPPGSTFNGLGLRFSPEDGVPGFFISLLRKRG